MTFILWHFLLIFCYEWCMYVLNTWVCPSQLRQELRGMKGQLSVAMREKKELSDDLDKTKSELKALRMEVDALKQTVSGLTSHSS